METLKTTAAFIAALIGGSAMILIGCFLAALPVYIGLKLLGF